MVWHPGYAFADALGDQRLHPCLRAALGASDPDPATVFDAAFGLPLSTAVFCTVKPTLGTRNWRASGNVGYLATRSGRDVKITSRWTGMGSVRFHAIVRALALP